MERPTYAQVMEWLEERRTILSTMHAAMTKDEEWFDAGTSDAAKQRVMGQLVGQGLPRKYPAKLIPLAYLGVMVGVNQIHVGESIDVKWVIDDDSYSDKERKARELKVTKWLKALVYQMDTFSIDAVLRDLVTKLISLGLGCISYSIAYDRWPEPPFGWVGRGNKRRPKPPTARTSRAEMAKWYDWQRERARAFPFNIETVHPCNLFFDPHHAVPNDYIREEIITSSEAAKYLGVAQPTGDQAPRHKRVTYASPQWIGQWVDGEPILSGDDVVDGVMSNTSGLPYHRMAFGGFGSTVRSGDFASKGKGIIRDGRDLIIMKVVILNTLERLRGLTAFRPLQVKGDDVNERHQVAERITYGPGEILESSNEVEVKEFPEVQVPAVVFQQMDQVDNLLETHFGPAILRGKGQPQETLGGQRNRFTIATAIYRAAQQAAQQITQAVLMDLIYLVKYELREDCPVVYGLDGTVAMIGPDDIDDGGKVVVDFSPPTEDEKAFNAENDRKDLEMGIITAEQYAQNRGYEDPAGQVRAVRKGKLVEMVLGSQAMGDMLTQHVMQQLGVAPPMQPAGTPEVAATPSGQTVQANPGTIAGNPQQQLSSVQMNDTYAAPVRR